MKLKKNLQTHREEEKKPSKSLSVNEIKCQSRRTKIFISPRMTNNTTKKIDSITLTNQ